ncbi:Immunoglobulin I-set [Trinorchestia longiramus]|nr:Immunoglobulin I-set [Trinorchestia longiramus]
MIGRLLHVLLSSELLLHISGSLHASKSLPQGRPSLNWDKYLLQPTFDESNRVKVVAAAGGTAFLHCKINHLADRAVTWIRKSDVQVLTVNSYTYTSDERFSAHSSDDADEWVLKLTSAQISDFGGYECQVSTETKMSLTFELEVIVAQAEISGTKEVFMNSGGDLDLRCTVPQITDPPDFILWYHHRTVINYSDRPGVRVTMNSARKTSRLFIKNAKAVDSGNYTCDPSNAEPAYVMVHIVKEERPAAMQHEDSGTNLSCHQYLVLTSALLVVASQILMTSTETTTAIIANFSSKRRRRLGSREVATLSDEDITLYRQGYRESFHVAAANEDDCGAKPVRRASSSCCFRDFSPARQVRAEVL